MGQSVIFALTVAAIMVTQVVSLNILAIFPFSGKSHFHMFAAIADKLVTSGHSITVVGHFPKSSTAAAPTGEGGGTYTDYSLLGTVPVYENFTTDEVFGSGYLEEFLAILQDGLDNCEGIMSSGRLDNLIRSETKFDLVIVEVRRVLNRKR